jgi:hypothetical protein
MFSSVLTKNNVKVLLAIVVVGCLSVAYFYAAKNFKSVYANPDIYGNSQVNLTGYFNTDVISNNSNIRDGSMGKVVKYITQFGGYGTGDGQFNVPVQIALGYDGDVYVTDAFKRVERFNSNGAFLMQIVPEIYNSLCSWPTTILMAVRGVAVDDAGNVFITFTCGGSDEGLFWEGEIDKYSAGGIWQEQYKMMDDTHSFDGATGITLDAAGNIYFMNMGDSIFKLNNSGVFQWYFTVPLGLPQYVAVDSFNNFYISSGKMLEYNSNKLLQLQMGAIGVNQGSGDGQFYNTEGVAVDSADNIYLTRSLPIKDFRYLIKMGYFLQNTQIKDLDQVSLIILLV